MSKCYRYSRQTTQQPKPIVINANSLYVKTILHPVRPRPLTFQTTNFHLHSMTHLSTVFIYAMMKSICYDEVGQLKVNYGEVWFNPTNGRCCMLSIPMPLKVEFQFILHEYNTDSIDLRYGRLQKTLNKMVTQMYSTCMWTVLCKFSFYLEFTVLQWKPFQLLKYVCTSTSLCAWLWHEHHYTFCVFGVESQLKSV